MLHTESNPITSANAWMTFGLTSSTVIGLPSNWLRLVTLSVDTESEFP